MLSPTTGVPVSGQSRATANAKSPFTGLIGGAQAGGFWPAQFKFSGFDGMVITGKSTKPVYLWIHDGQAEIRDASHLWGKLTGNTEELIKMELGDNKIEVAEIGPAGEQLIPMANIMNMHNRAFGRTGMGAVMGSKNLKAIAVRGNRKVEVADKPAVTRIARSASKLLPNNPDMQGMQNFGTASVLNFQNSSGGLPTRNYTSGVFEFAEDISGETMADTILKENDTCYACTVRCKRVVEAEFNNQKIYPDYGGPEYETMSTFGSYCGIRDLKAVALAHQICAQYGIDTISCGATVAFAMECFEKDILTLEDTQGIDLRFGNAEAMVAVLEKIVIREGVGDLLADGSFRAAKKLGPVAEKLTVTSKGQEFPAHMPQVKRSLALIYAVNPFGADHQSNEHDPAYNLEAPEEWLQRMAMLGLTDPQPDQVLNREKVKFALYGQWNYSFLDTSNLCQFVYGPGWQLMGPGDAVELVKAVTGWDFSIEEMQRIGERCVNLMRVFNAREGAGRDRDTLPAKMYDVPLQGGHSDGWYITREEFESALNDYYEMAGWDQQTGTPTRQKLEELGLGWAS
jgi:aldehyde:ferredoxin oxidoreductase